MKMKYKIFNVLVLSSLLVPTLGLAVNRQETTSEKRELAKFPSLMDAGQLNFDLLDEMGEWYDDHFAFRANMIDAYATLEQDIFSESSVRNVIVGNEGWLFYRETLDQYIGNNALSDRQIENIVHNLGLYQYALNSQGIEMMVTIAPNKNTVYPEYMKSRYLQSETSDLDRFAAALKEAGIPYTDLKTPLCEDDRALYYQKDSHWNSQGALLAYNTLMDQLGLEHDHYQALPNTMIEHNGDLDGMIHPTQTMPEEDYDYTNQFAYQLENEIADYMDNWIETSNSNGKGTLFMFRDSFGEALAPFLANAFSCAYFSRLEPYNLLQMSEYQPDVVLFERAERRIAGFGQQAAIMNMPVVDNFEATKDLQDHSYIALDRQNDWYLISGDVNAFKDKEQLYLQVEVPNQPTYTYPVFYVDGGFQIFLPVNRIPKSATLSVIRQKDHQAKIVDRLELGAQAQ